MRNSLLLLVLFTLPVTVGVAAELESEIPVDLVRALFELPDTGEMRFYSEIPETFPDFTVPPEFQILGGMEMPNFSRVGLQSALTLNEGMAVLSSSLQDDQYLFVPFFGHRENGFLAAETLPLPANFCNDEKGSIRIRAIKRNEEHFFSLTGGPAVDASGVTCEVTVAERQALIEAQLTRESSGINRYLPRLEIPQEQDIEYRGFSPPMRFSGSDTRYEVSSQIMSRLGAFEIYRHFSAQLLSQNWTSSQELRGTNSANGQWRLVTDEDQLIFGVLNVQEQGNDNFRLQFSISTSGDLFIIEPGIPQRVPQ